MHARAPINYPNDTDVKITRDMDGLISITVDASGTTTNLYYPSAWLKTVTTSSTFTKIITYQYNGVGLVSNMQVSGESSFTYSYNARNQLSSVTNPNSVQVSFTYDNGGRRTRITDPGSYVEYVYNARNWITDVRNRTTGGTTRYDATYYYQDGTLWDHTGNPVKRTENLAGSTYTTTLRYDAVYRQTQETKKDSSNNTIYDLAYGYDAVGNRTTRTLAGTITYWTYDDHNKLTKIGTQPGYNDLATFGYDSNGNMTSVSGTLFGSKSMVYNDQDRLTSITCGGTTDLYYYNWQGQRYRARLGGVYSRYLYHGQRVLEELNDSGAMQARYTTENGTFFSSWLHLHRPTGSLSRFPMYDNIGTARGLLDASGTATDWYELDTFGRQVSSSGTTPNPYRYGGAWGYITDPSGMLQLGERFLWTDLGRFLQQDVLPDAANLYSYVSASPTRGIDPDGRQTYRRTWTAEPEDTFRECLDQVRDEYWDCLCQAGIPQRVAAGGAGAFLLGAARRAAAGMLCGPVCSIGAVVVGGGAVLAALIDFNTCNDAAAAGREACKPAALSSNGGWSPSD